MENGTMNIKCESITSSDTSTKVILDVITKLANIREEGYRITSLNLDVTFVIDEEFSMIEIDDRSEESDE